MTKNIPTVREIAATELKAGDVITDHGKSFKKVMEVTVVPQTRPRIGKGVCVHFHGGYLDYYYTDTVRVLAK